MELADIGLNVGARKPLKVFIKDRAQVILLLMLFSMTPLSCNPVKKSVWNDKQEKTVNGYQ